MACADALVASIAEQRLAGARRFALVAEWADYNHPDRDKAVTCRPRSGPAAGAAPEVGADGTPPVADLAVTELGMLLHTTTYAAEALLRDVLELRHRLPRVWEAVLTGRLEDWKARQVARCTHRLSCEHAQRVDAQVIEALLGLPWGRALAVVEGRVIAVDPAGHQARLAEEETAGSSPPAAAPTRPGSAP